MNIAVTVHPRIRGERLILGTNLENYYGSSPHTRGTLGFGQPHARRQRFIPAYAGNADDYCRDGHGPTVHPRIRGERRIEYARAPVAYGSSPHTRGTRRPCSQSAASERFIPAYAGNASTRKRLMASATVHPRIRGERVLVT